MYKTVILACLSAALSLSAADVGVVNFTACMSDSKQGKQQQEQLDTMREQMVSMVEKVEKELKEISSKLDDESYLDTLSPQAEEDLKARQQSLQEELGRYQGQFYQVLSQANQQALYTLSQGISEAAREVAEQVGLDYVLNKDACFYVKDAANITTAVIAQMDHSFDLKVKTNEAQESAVAQETPSKNQVPSQR
jgi:outer membrane protein